LGDEVYFAQQLPWIWGSIDQVHGSIDVSFMVKGSKGRAMMRFRSLRRTRMGFVSIPSFFCFDELCLEEGEFYGASGWIFLLTMFCHSSRRLSGV